MQRPPMGNRWPRRGAVVGGREELGPVATSKSQVAIKSKMNKIKRRDGEMESILVIAEMSFMGGQHVSHLGAATRYSPFA